MKLFNLAFAVCITALASYGCSSTPPVIPEDLQPHIDTQLSFEQVLQNPDSFKGKVLILGGEVLSAKGLREGTELEILQLPLDGQNRPHHQRTSSQGRFLAINKEFLDPATFPKDTRVTLVGMISGVKVGPLDETEYRYPTLQIQHLHVWMDDPNYQLSNGSPSWGIFGGGGTGGRVGGGVSIGIGF